MSETSWLRLRPGGTPEAGFGARSGLRLLQAPGQASPPGPLWPAMQSSSRLDMEQDSRHAVRMKPGFELHSPSAAQVRQLSLVSMHSSDGEAPPDASTCARTTSCARALCVPSIASSIVDGKSALSAKLSW
eukprot:scaffold99748_cov56-Phaeocystis_antarctica.AAC.3